MRRSTNSPTSWLFVRATIAASVTSKSGPSDAPEGTAQGVGVRCRGCPARRPHRGGRARRRPAARSADRTRRTRGVRCRRRRRRRTVRRPRTSRCGPADSTSTASPTRNPPTRAVSTVHRDLGGTDSAPDCVAQRRRRGATVPTTGPRRRSRRPTGRPCRPRRLRDRGTARSPGRSPSPTRRPRSPGRSRASRPGCGGDRRRLGGGLTPHHDVDVGEGLREDAAGTTGQACP